MATKSSGSMGGDSTKAAGSLEKDPTAGADTDAADAGSGYDDSGSSDVGYSYDSGGSSGGSGGSSGSGGGSDGGGGSGSSGGSDGGGEDTATDDDPGGTNEREGEAGDDTRDDSGGDGSDGGDSGGDSGGESPYDTDDLVTLPGEVEQPKDEDPGNPEDPGNGGRVAVDIDLMITLIASMEQARDEIPDLEQRMRSILSDLDLDPSEVAGLDRVISWIEGELPGLRRRLALARALEEGRIPRLPQPRPVPLPTPREPIPLPTPEPRFRIQPDETRPVEPQPEGRQPIIWDEDHIVTVEPHEATDNGRRAAALIARSDGAGVTEAAQLMRSHQADPYFAREFASNTDPSFIVETIAEAERGADETDLGALVRSTVATANQATGELAVGDETRDAWAGALA